MAKPKYTPAQRKELQRVLIRQLKDQVRDAKGAIRDSKKATARHRRELQELEKRLREAEAELRKKPRRAQLQRLPKKWKAHWIEVYDERRASGVDKGTAAAIAWANIKRYCVKSEEDGEWICFPYDKAFEESVMKTTKRAKDLTSKVSGL
jgi:hypothetical protein